MFRENVNLVVTLPISDALIGLVDRVRSVMDDVFFLRRNE